MKRNILIAVLAVVILSGAFIGGAWFYSRFSKQLLTDYNGMASGNFSVALASFRDDYHTKRVSIFGEVKEKTTFRIKDFEFVVMPTIEDRSSDPFNPEFCNMASHTNGMVVMLACKWIADGDSRGDELLIKLKELIPSYNLSAPNIKNIKITDLKKGSSMAISEANQWDWRMADIPK